MMNPLSIQNYAKMFAKMEVATRASQLEGQQSDLDTETAALQALETALTGFQTAVDALNSETSGPVVNTVSANNDSATITANSQAQPGTYTFFVEQLASAQQSAYSIPDDSIPNSGTFTITMGDSAMDIDLSTADSDKDGAVSVAELCVAINSSEDNPGVTATLVNTDGSTTMVLTSDATGAANGFTVSTSGIDPASAFAKGLATPNELSAAQDAVIYLGSAPPADGQNVPTITSSSNTFTDLIPGLNITFAEESKEGEPLTFTVSNDQAATQAKVQTFADAYNALVDSLDALTASGSNGSAGGAFAGDSGIGSLERQIQSITHASYNGVSIIDYGITLDNDGHLQIDSEEFNAAMKENPDGLTSLFVGPESMTAALDDVLDTYLNSNDGIIKQRQSNIDEQQSKLTTEIADLTETYNSSYDRYLAEFTATMVEISSMQRSMAAFL